MCSLLHAYLLVVLPLKSMVAPLSVFILRAYASMYLSCVSSEACTLENTRFWIGVLTLCLLSPRLYPDEKLGKSWKREEHARLSRVYLPSRLQRLKLGVNLSSPWSAKAAVVNKACRCLFSSSSLIFFNLISTVFCLNTMVSDLIGYFPAWREKRK